MKSAGSALVDRLQRAGLLAILSLPGDGGLRAYDWEKMVPQLPAATQELWRFFLLGAGLPVSRLRELLGDAAIDFLRAHRLCGGDNGEISLGSLSLVYYKRMCFFIERSSQPRAYFGEDTKALLTLLPAGLKTGRCLCLYPGTGAQILPLAAGREIEFTFAGGQYDRGILEANLQMNGGTGKARFLKSLPKGTGNYDLIVAAPPSTFEPPGVKMPKMVAGGRDGLRWVREVLSVGEKSLTADGELCVIFIFYGPKDSAVAKEKLKGFLDDRALDYRLILCSKHSLEPGVPVFNMLLGTAAASKPQDAPKIAEKMTRHLRGLGVDTAYLVKATFRPRATEAQREMVDFSDLYYGSWTF
jgi:hypothetical protein